MEIRRHLSQHDAAEELPLVSDSATVTSVEPMDRDRTDEVLAATVRTIERHGRDEWLEHVDAANANVEWDALQARLDGVGNGRPAAELGVLRERHGRAYPSTLRIRLATGEPFAFLPGQYVTVRYDEIARPYSLACSPNRDGLEICVRRVPGGRLTGELFAACSAGDEVSVRGPNGELLLADVSERDLVFLATGTGVAPFRSMIDYTFEEGRDEFAGGRRDVWLFLGAAWEDDLPYHEEFRALAEERGNFHYVPTLSRESYLSDWEGETAYVQQLLLTYLDREAVDPAKLGRRARRSLDREPRYDVDARLDPANVEVYACGINAMVNGLVDAATRIGVPAGRIEAEGFG